MLFLLFSHKFSLVLISNMISVYITSSLFPIWLLVFFVTKPLNGDTPTPSLESPFNRNFRLQIYSRGISPYCQKKWKTLLDLTALLGLPRFCHRYLGIFGHISNKNSLLLAVFSKWIWKMFATTALCISSVIFLL